MLWTPFVALSQARSTEASPEMLIVVRISASSSLQPMSFTVDSSALQNLHSNFKLLIRCNTFLPQVLPLVRSRTHNDQASPLLPAA